jgi:4'-phosphopantetheinyl transferase
MAAPALTPREVHVWLAFDAAQPPPEVAAQFVAKLPEGERARLALGTETRRREMLLTRWLQRQVLSRYEPRIEPHEWRFVADHDGRPQLAPDFQQHGLHFNLAHTQGLVVMAVARLPRVGVDVEVLERRVPLAVAPRYFTADEADALAALAPEAQPRRFIELWTLKEAYLKALGSGLAGGLGAASFEFEAGVIRCAIHGRPATGWTFAQHEIESRYMLAVAVEAGTQVPAVTLHRL